MASSTRSPLLWTSSFVTVLLTLLALWSPTSTASDVISTTSQSSPSASSSSHQLDHNYNNYQLYPSEYPSSYLHRPLMSILSPTSGYWGYFPSSRNNNFLYQISSQDDDNKIFDNVNGFDYDDQNDVGTDDANDIDIDDGIDIRRKKMSDISSKLPADNNDIRKNNLNLEENIKRTSSPKKRALSLFASHWKGSDNGNGNVGGPSYAIGGGGSGGGSSLPSGLSAVARMAPSSPSSSSIRYHHFNGHQYIPSKALLGAPLRWG